MREKKFDKPAYDRVKRKELYDDVSLNVRKGQKEVMRAAAKAAGAKSLNVYIIEAVEQRMEKEQSSMESSTMEGKDNNCGQTAD